MRNEKTPGIEVDNTAKQFSIVWHDSGREPRAKPDAAFPNGIDLDISQGRTPCCTITLSYPAKRIGQYSIRCILCELTTVVTTAGRPDDPRSVKVACKLT